MMKTAVKEKVTLTKWDLADDINTIEDAAFFLMDALEDDDPAFVRVVIDDIARSKAMTLLEKDFNITRESLCNSLLSDGIPTFGTVAKFLYNLGFYLNIEPKEQAE